MTRWTLFKPTCARCNEETVSISIVFQALCWIFDLLTKYSSGFVCSTHHLEIQPPPQLVFDQEAFSATKDLMPTAQFCHEITTSSSYRSLTINLQVTHTIDILKPSPNATKIQASSLPWLQTVEFGSELDLSLTCVIEGTAVPCRHLRAFSFVSDVVMALREVCANLTSQALTLSLPSGLL